MKNCIIDPGLSGSSIGRMKTLFKTSLFAAAAMLAAVTSASAQGTTTSYFLNVEGIPGDSTQPGHTGHIDVISFNLGVEQRGISDFGGGGGAGKSSFKPFLIHKQVDKASPKLFLACATGQHIKKATLFVQTTRNEGPPVNYLVITMEDVIISSVNHVGAESANGDLLLESCSLNYAKIEFKYTPVLADGTTGAPITVGFDLKKNKFIGSAAPILTGGLLQGL